MVPVTAAAVNVAGAAAAAEGVAAANTAVAVSSATAGAAIAEQTVETAVLGAQQTKASAITTNFAKAQALGASATARLAGAAQAAALTTSELASSRAILRETSAAVSLAERAVGAALVAGNIALIDAAANTLSLARARQAEATTAVEAAIAERGLAAAQARSASQQQFIARGAGATALSLAGVRGATLAANSAFLIGAAAAVGFAKAIQGAAGLEQELNVFRITAQATADEMRRVSEEATRLGADISLPGVSSRDAAESMTELAKAGLDVRDSIGGARGVLQLAAAAQISNAEATELAANALNAFGLSGVEAVHVADLLANAANNAQGSISDMGLALRQSAAVARLAGFSIEDTAALLTLLAKNGLRGSDAGTALRTSLIRLIHPTKAARTEIEKLELNLRDVQGNLRPEVFAEFAEATAGMSRAQQDATAALVFGQDAIRAQAILGREGASGLDAMRIALERQGAAAELAGARAQGFSGQMNALQSNLETLGTALGGFVLPGLTAFVGVLNDIASDVNTVVGGIKTITGGIGGLKDEAKESVPVLGLVEDHLLRTARGLIETQRSGGLFGRAIIVGVRQFSDGSDSIRESTEEIGANVRKVIASLEGPIGSTDLNAAVLALQEMADKLATGDAEARRASRTLKELIKDIQDVGGLPSPVVEILMKLNKAGLKTEATSGAQIVLDAMTASLSPAAADALGFGFMEDVGEGMKRAAPAAGTGAGQILVQSLATQLSVAQATGSDSQVLAILRQREAKQAAFLQKILARPQDAKTQALVRKAAANLEQTRNDIQGILDEQTSDAQQAKDKIITARKEADQALLDAFSSRVGAQQNRILVATATATLSDDIQAQEDLRSIVQQQIAVAKTRISDQQELAQFLQSQTAKLLQINQQIADLRKQQISVPVTRAEERVQSAGLTDSLDDDIRAQINLRKIITEAISKLRVSGIATIAEIKEYIQQRNQVRQEIADLLRQQRERVREGLQLDVELADIRASDESKNITARIRTRERLIAQLQKLQNTTKKGSVEWKRYRNLIAQEQAEIDDLRKQVKERDNRFRELTFQFLQTQQGFAANLLGNLIPSGVTGLSGGGGGGTPGQFFGAGESPAISREGGLSGLLTQEAGLAQGGKGPSQGQLSELIEINRQMARLLSRIAGDAKHPEAKRSKMSSRAMLDMLA